MSSDAESPVIRIVRGNPSAEEVAALIAVLAAAGGATEPDESPRARGWASPAARLRSGKGDVAHPVADQRQPALDEEDADQRCHEADEDGREQRPLHEVVREQLGHDALPVGPASALPVSDGRESYSSWS